MLGRDRPQPGRRQSALGNPVLIGALTVLITIVAVTLAYQANTGLPFVPRYDLRVQLRNATELTRGGEVHMGGSLVGRIDSITPERDHSGKPIALLDLKLDRSIEPLPVDSRFDVRLKAAIGLKYLEVKPGASPHSFRGGATVPISQTSAEVDLGEVLGMFDPPTRAGVRASTIGFSDGLAGRGIGINNAIGAFVPLVTDLGPVMRNLAARGTDLGGFFRGLERFTGALVPVAGQQASLYGHLATTFRALAGVAVPYLQRWIAATPPSFRTVIADSPSERIFLHDTAALFADLRPGVATLQGSAPVLADAFAAGAQNLPATAALDARVTSLSRRLGRYSQTPAVSGGLDRLALTLASLRAPLAFLTPVQASCNYVTLFLRNVASTLGQTVGTGTILRFNLVTIDDVLGGEGVPSRRPYTTPDPSTTDEHGPLRSNPYPNTGSPGQTRECAAGNEPYSGSSSLIGNPARNVGLSTELTTRSKR